MLCDRSGASFLILIGIAAAVVFEVADEPSVGGEGETPAGEAVEEGNIRSSMFIGSSSLLYCVFDKSKDLRNFAIPDGALEFCWFRLTYKCQSRPGSRVHKRWDDAIRTVPAHALCASDSLPSSSKSDSPFAHGWAIASWSCCKASISALPAGPASASLRVV